MGDPVVHFEIQSGNPEELYGFYRDLFGWKVMAVPEIDYGLVDVGKPEGGDGINGGIGANPEGKELVTFYIEVPDIDAKLAAVEAAGGKILMPRADLGMVVLGMFADPRGNVIGLVEPGAAQPG